jgi:ring-1,2-phenylacetyl-CoA epoxidase subunit PaaE
MSNNFFSLTVKKIQRETIDAVSITFDVPDSVKDKYVFIQGQYLTLKTALGGKEQRRAYSICSSPLDGDLTIAVKKVDKGVVSTFLCDRLQEGHSLQVATPEGRFNTPLSIEQRKDYFLFGAGSGITPLMSILTTIIETEPTSKVHLLYGNRNEDNIIFNDKLTELAQKYAGQLTVEHILSQPKREKGGFFSKGKITWAGKVGRIDKPVVEAFLTNNPMTTKEAIYFICGPNAMMTTVEAVLKAQGVDKKHIHAEHFNNEGAATDPSVAAASVDGAKVTVTFMKKTDTVHVPKGERILDVLLKNKIDAPYSCTSGACSTCMAKVTSGTTKMDACFALDDDEVAAGYVLTCQAHPTSAEVVLTFDH